MILTRDKGSRMWGGGVSVGSGGGGGLDPSALAGYATQGWVEENYVSKDYFSQVFTVKGTKTTQVGSADPTTVPYTFAPNEVPAVVETEDETTHVITKVTTVITNVEVRAGLWTNSYVSALGQNSGGGGGGGLTLNEPLYGINNANLAAHPSAAGMAIIWDGTKWVYGQTSVDLSDYATKAWVEAKDYLVDSDLDPYALSGWVSTNFASKDDIADMATKTWVGQNYISIAFFSRLFQAKNGSTNVNPNDTSSTIDNIKAMFGFWTDQYLSALGQNSGGGGGGLTLNEPLYGINNASLGSPSAAGQVIMWNGTSWAYAIPGSGGSSTLAGLSDVNLSSLGNGELLVYNSTSGKWENDDILSSYATTSWVTSQVSAISGTFWGQSWTAGGTVTGNMTDVGGITMSGNIVMNNGQSIRMKDSFGNDKNLLTLNSVNTLALGYNTRQAGYTTDIQGDPITFATNGGSNSDNRLEVGEFTEAGCFWIKVGTQGIRIGDAKIVWDSAHNALKVIKADGSDCNFYATGGVSALGVTS